MSDASTDGHTFADVDRPVRDEAWVADTFGDVGPAPSNEVEVDENAEGSPNTERPCEGEVADD